MVDFLSLNNFDISTYTCYDVYNVLCTDKFTNQYLTTCIRKDDT